MLKNVKNSSFIFVSFLLLYEFSVYIANDMIMPGMIHVVNEFSVDDSFIPRSLSIFILGGATLQIFLGPLSDKYGRRKIMLFGVFFFLLSTIANGIATSIEQFMFARFAQGMGICYIGVIGYAVVQEMFEEKKAVKILSIMTTISILAPLLGPLGGSIYLEYYNWRGINAIIAVFTVASLIGLFFFFPRNHHFKLQNQKHKTLLSKEQPHFFIVSVKNYLAIVKNKKFMIGVAAFSIINIPLIIWIAISPIVLVKKAGLSQLEYGFFQFPVFGGFIIGVLILQRLLRVSSLESIIFKGSVLSVIGLILCLFLPIIFHEHYLSVIIPFSIYTIGFGIISSPIYRLVLFSSNIAKGSVSAAFSLISMLLFGIGTESIAVIYRAQSNISLGFFLCILGLIYVFPIRFFLLEHKREKLELEKNEMDDNRKSFK